MASERLGLGSLRLGGIPASSNPIGSNLNPEHITDPNGINGVPVDQAVPVVRPRGWCAVDPNGDIWVCTGSGQGAGSNGLPWFNASSARRDLDGGLPVRVSFAIAADPTAIVNGTLIHGWHQSAAAFGDITPVTFEFFRTGSPAAGGHIGVDITGLNDAGAAQAALRAAIESDPTFCIGYIGQESTGAAGTFAQGVITVAPPSAFVNNAWFRIPTGVGSATYCIAFMVSGAFNPASIPGGYDALIDVTQWGPTGNVDQLMTAIDVLLQANTSLGYPSGGSGDQTLQWPVAGAAGNQPILFDDLGSGCIAKADFGAVTLGTDSLGTDSTLAVTYHWQWSGRGSGGDRAWRWTLSPGAVGIALSVLTGTTEISSLLANFGDALVDCGQSYAEWKQYQGLGDGAVVAAMIAQWRANGGHF